MIGDRLVLVDRYFMNQNICPPFNNPSWIDNVILFFVWSSINIWFTRIPVEDCDSHSVQHKVFHVFPFCSPGRIWFSTPMPKRSSVAHSSTRRTIRCSSTSGEARPPANSRPCPSSSTKLRARSCTFRRRHSRCVSVSVSFPYWRWTIGFLRHSFRTKKLLQLALTIRTTVFVHWMLTISICSRVQNRRSRVSLFFF